MKSLNSSTIKKPVHPVRMLQFGEGNFLRAFVDWMIDIADEKGVTDMSVAVVSPRFKNNEGIRTLKAQDGIYHVCLEGVENGSPKTESRMITCIADVFSPLDDIKKYEDYVVSPELRFVVSNTTEAGIRYEKDDILSDVPVTFPGKIAAMLYRRYRHFDGDKSKGLIFLCCELIEDNGSTLRQYVIRHAEEAGLEPAFVEWIREACIFCDTLVDRIVPGFPKDSIDEVKSSLGYDDNMVVKGELYHVWAIGGDDYMKVGEELPLDKAGLNVLFLPSIKEFRDKKVRILNGSHTGMVPIALQLGCETVLEASENPLANKFVKTMVDREVLPMIDGDKAELKHFADGILERFYNPYVRHMLKSIALNSLSKWEARNFPTVRDLWTKKGEYADFELFTFASLMSLYAPDSDFEPEDNASHLGLIRTAWAENSGDYAAIIRQIVGNGIFIEDFETIVPGFSERAAGYLTLIKSKGMSSALEDFLSTRD